MKRLHKHKEIGGKKRDHTCVVFTANVCSWNIGCLGQINTNSPALDCFGGNWSLPDTKC